MITSRKPISYPIREALTFPDMKIVRFSAELRRGKMRVSATLQNFNDATETFDPDRNHFRVDIEDLAAASVIHSVLRTLWQNWTW